MGGQTSVATQQRGFARSQIILSDKDNTINLYDKGYQSAIPIKTNAVVDTVISDYSCFFGKIEPPDLGEGDEYRLPFSLYKNTTPNSPIFRGVLITSYLSLNRRVVKEGDNPLPPEVSVTLTGQTVTLSSTDTGDLFYFSSYFDPLFNYYIQDVTYYSFQSGSSNIKPDSTAEFFTKMKITDNIEVGLSFKTDNWGLNLSEMICNVSADKSYPNGYVKKFIGYCDKIPQPILPTIQTLYSFNPNLSKVLKCKGSSILDQTIKINNKFNNVKVNEVDKNCYFYDNILSYCTLRYMFGGLSNESKFSCKWLYANHYEEFLENLKNSDFAAVIVFFINPIYGFSDYNKYFRICKK